MQIISTVYVWLVVFAAILFAAWQTPLDAALHLSAGDWRTVAAFAGLALLTQMAATDFGARQARTTLAFIPLLAGAMVLPPAATLLTATPVIALSEAILRRPLLKALFNIAQITLAVGLGASAYHWWAARDGVAFSYIGAVLLFSTAFATNLVLSSLALAFFRGESVIPTFKAVVGPKGANLFYDVLSSPFVVITVAVYSVYGTGGMFLLILPLLLLRHTYSSRQKLEHANHDLLFALVKAIETRDVYTSGHSRRVATLARLIAEDMGLSARRTQRVATAALLHDIGKIDADLSSILLKPHSLTPEERELIQTHAERGANLLRDLGSMDGSVVAAVRHHHERFDGKGYPDGIKGGDIPLEARIIMMSDSIDAMLSDRPYRRALKLDTVRSELETNKGSQFDPAIVDIVLERDTVTRAVALVDEWRDAQKTRDYKIAAAT